VVAGDIIVAGFIALLNTAVTTALEQMPVETSSGATATTVGGVKGEVAPPELLSESPHPATIVASRNNGIQKFLKFELRISFSSLHTCKAIRVEPRYQECTDLQTCCLCHFAHHRQSHRYIEVFSFAQFQEVSPC
jgi:hypothetical protein